MDKALITEIIVNLDVYITVKVSLKDVILNE